jgi:hypothetical protein
MPDSAHGIRALSEAIAELLVERQRLRGRGAGRREFEANRLEHVRRQHQLSIAIIGRYCFLPSDRGAA